MFDYDNWQEIFSTIKKNKLRSALTAFGVFWGIFMLIIMLGSGKGLENGTTSDFKGFATNSFYIWAQSTSKPYKGFKPNRAFDFLNSDIEAIRSNVPEAIVVSARNQLGDYGGNTEVVHKTKGGSFNVMGDFPDFTQIQPIKNLQGRFINQTDITDKRKIVVIGNRVQEVLFAKGEDPLNQFIKINGIYFRVVGFFKSEKTSDGGELASSIFVPFSTFQQSFNFGNRVGWFSIVSRNDVPASVTQEKVIKLLKSRHSIAPDDKLAIGCWNPQIELDKMNGLFAGIKLLIWIVGTGTLLAGVIGVSNILLIVVKERTQEIGIKRALGAKPIHIVTQIISEAVFLTSIAGYLGLLCGVALIEFISDKMKEESGMFRSPEVDFSVAIAALCILILGGVVAGIIPAIRAVRITPVNALRGG
jgi:putative ABC transport system permease protein